MSEHWEDRLHRERDEARELADFRGEQVVRLSEECAQLRARVAELEAHLPRMDGPSRVEYLERRVAELEARVDDLQCALTQAEARIRDLESANAALELLHKLGEWLREDNLPYHWLDRIDAILDER